ncbi:hypothetical protein QM012_006210 [Aureobasidium pullulans]|uniref:RING-type domain-containing protein n=1 Tax=Aureobasidium pullulans TaxID=5580 RepID=A0ABR0TS25_AURPU
MTSLRIDTYDESSTNLVPQGVAFNVQNSNVLTLNSGSQSPQSLGFLYVPDVAGVCAQSLPQNVTRYQDLPPTNHIVAIAPWLSPSCTLSYLQAASNDMVAAFVFYIPDQTNPPLAPANSPTWDLGDGGHWRSAVGYSVFAVTSSVGQLTLEQLALYSGNASSVLSPQELADHRINPATQLRLLIDITTSSGGSNLPSIWIFLLIILAVLIVFIGALSLTMHILQRKRRNDLRARIARGEVDIEALGLGKLTVPQDIIDQMPTYTPSAHAGVPEKGSARALPPLEQSTCAICLDDFTDSQCQVRELPCRHVFHNDCIDLFLLDTSSMCPLCKRSVLPKGYVPGKITNAHVRRERYLRRNAARRARHAAAGGETSNPSNLTLFGPQARASTNSGEQPSEHAPQIELTSMPEYHGAYATRSSTITPQGRREWARRRALAMLRPQNSSSDESDPEPRTSKARELLRKVFPNL